MNASELLKIVHDSIEIEERAARRAGHPAIVAAHLAALADFEAARSRIQASRQLSDRLLISA